MDDRPQTVVPPPAVSAPATIRHQPSVVVGSPSSGDGEWTIGDKIAAGITLLLTLVFLGLFAFTLLIYGWAPIVNGGYADDDPFFGDQQLVDESSDPLEDFSRFTCPKYYKPPPPVEDADGTTVTIPTTTTTTNTVSFVPSALSDSTAPPPEGWPTRTERFYQWWNYACNFQKMVEKAMAEANLEIKIGPKEEAFFRELLDDAFKGSVGFRYKDLSIEQNYSSIDVWRTAGELRRNFGVTPPFSIFVQQDRFSQKKIIYISQNFYGIPEEWLNATYESKEFEELYEAVRSVRLPFFVYLHSIMREGTNETSDTVYNFYTSILLRHIEYMLALSRAHDKQQDGAEATMKFSDTQRTLPKNAKMQKMTVGQLIAKYPNIQWRAFFSGLFGRKIGDGTKVSVISPKFLERLNEFFGGESSLDYMHVGQIVELLTQINTKLGAQSCWKVIYDELPHVMGYWTMARHPQAEVESKVYAVGQMIKPIVEEYKAAILESDWPTEATKKNLINKVKSMRVFIGWPKWYKLYEPVPENETASIDKYHEKLLKDVQKIPVQKFSMNYTEGGDMATNLAVVDQNTAIYYRAMLAIVAFKTRRELDELDKKSDPEETMNPLLNANYAPWLNSLTVAYYWIWLYFKSEQMVETYGRIGHTIAHEIGHGFDPNGMLYDANGFMTDKLLDHKSALEYDKIQECVVNLYSRECCPEQAANFTSVHCADGWKSQGENFADISGVTIAYRAFKRRQNLLNGGHFELAKRKFWVGYSGLWCGERETDAELENSLVTDPHPPMECRVNLVTKSVPQFAYDFGNKWPLNNGNRCYLWLARAQT